MKKRENGGDPRTLSARDQAMIEVHRSGVPSYQPIISLPDHAVAFEEAKRAEQARLQQEMDQEIREKNLKIFHRGILTLTEPFANYFPNVAAMAHVAHTPETRGGKVFNRMKNCYTVDFQTDTGEGYDSYNVTLNYHIEKPNKKKDDVLFVPDEYRQFPQDEESDDYGLLVNFSQGRISDVVALMDANSIARRFPQPAFKDMAEVSYQPYSVGGLLFSVGQEVPSVSIINKPNMPDFSYVGPKNGYPYDSLNDRFSMMGYEMPSTTYLGMLGQVLEKIPHNKGV